MKFPPHFISSLQNAPGFEEKSFVEVHESGRQVTSIRINPAKTPPIFPFENAVRIPWTEYGYYLPERPSFTFDPLFHAGCYYVQEASSMFLEQALRQCVDLDKDLKILDLCAAPGGKSTHIQSLVSPSSLLLSNEVIRSRGNILRDNMIKWGCSNVVVTHNDPAHFASLENYFDVIIVDAPCSGSGLFRKDPAACDEWSPANVQLCSQRQRRILTDCWPALRNGGVLIYATCSYSVEEDEQIGQWLEKTMDAGMLSLDFPADWGIVSSDPGYRFWPHRLEGEGFFLVCFRKKSGDESNPSMKTKKMNTASRIEANEVSQWIEGAFTFIKNGEEVYAWPEKLATDFAYLLGRLRVSYSGTHVGTFARDRLIPSHALSMSVNAGTQIPRVALDRENAVRYLQRKDIRLAGKGWTLATFEDMPLGWVNILPNRVNNYYPKELRILRDI